MKCVKPEVSPGKILPKFTTPTMINFVIPVTNEAPRSYFKISITFNQRLTMTVNYPLIISTEIAIT